MFSILGLVLCVGSSLCAVATNAGNAAGTQELQIPVNPETKIVEYKSPVKRVVNLLNKMKEELEHEADNEAAMYDKMVCWCETNEKEKTRAIADADAKDLELTATIEGMSARFGVLVTEIAQLKKQITEDTDALKQATAIRETEAGAFRGEERDLVQAIDNLRNAIAVLAKHHGGSLLQTDAPLLSGLRVLLRDTALKYEMLLADGKQRHVLKTVLLSVNEKMDKSEDRATVGVSKALLSALDVHGAEVSDTLPVKFALRMVAQAAESNHVAKSAFLQSAITAPKFADHESYSPRSSAIFGVLNQMLEEFQAEVSQDQKDEQQAIVEFEALAKAKKEQITVAKEKLDNFEGENAENIKALSDAKEDLALTRETRSADVKFLHNLKLTCNDLDTQWERRSATRSEEIKAVSEATYILTEDDNREMLHKSVTLLQERSERMSTEMMARRNRAADSLLRAAQLPDFDADDLLSDWHGRHGSVAVHAVGPRSQLSTLALGVKLDSFTKVKEMMDKMLTELKAQQEEEAKFKAYCIKELDENEKATYGKNEEKNDLESKIEELTRLLTKLAKEIAEHKAQIATTEVEIKKASQNREAENAAFQQTVADQRATQSILEKALLRLQDFYKKDIGRKIIDLQVEQTPPVQFNKFKNNAGASPVMGLIEQIIGDSKALESEATSGEYSAQADYEKFVNDSNALIDQLSASVASKEKATAATNLDKAETESDLENAIGELESLAAYEADLHGQCDWVVKNFDIRQAARLQEMEAIQAAKSILSGDEQTGR